jgi:hypothetical protein
VGYTRDSLFRMHLYSGERAKKKKKSANCPSNRPINRRLQSSYKSHVSSVGKALGYGLDDRGSRVRFPAGEGNFSLHHRAQNGSGAHRASYPMGTRGPFPGSKAAGA